MELTMPNTSSGANRRTSMAPKNTNNGIIFEESDHNSQSGLQNIGDINENEI